jgi:CYTH domain-containing protein
MPSPRPELVPGKYALVERERRFLLAGMPAGERPAGARQITDHYLIGTSLRLRCVRQAGGDQYKLTQKIPAAQPGPVQGLITNIYLSKAEHDQLVAALPGRRLAKTRYSVPPLSIDVFGPPLHGLVIGEAEFGTDAEMLAFQPPGYARAEITGDRRFTGGCLAITRREDLVSWLAQYGISPHEGDLNQP